MNKIDALCKLCGKAFRWLSGTPMACPDCLAGTGKQEGK